MALVQGKQPSVRFDASGPFGFQGVSFVPKVITFKKDAISGTSNNDFWVAPAGTFIAQVGVRCETLLDGSGTVQIGTDGNPDAFVDSTGFDASTTASFGTNIGTTVAAASGLYLPAGDTIRLEIGGTPTVGAVSGFIVYYEVGSMVDEGLHFDIA
jgi:hypothetical protein